MHQLSTVTAPDSEEEYRTIEAALLNNARGRWFLAEHGRRSRRLDSALLDESIKRLQVSLRQPPALLGQLKLEIGELSRMLTDTREQLVSRTQARRDADTAALASQDPPTTPMVGIIRAAEEIHRLAWSLHTTEVDVPGCETIARQASLIYAMSHAQAVESQNAQQITLALERAGTQLMGLLETVTHELQIDGEDGQAAAQDDIAALRQE